MLSLTESMPGKSPYFLTYTGRHLTMTDNTETLLSSGKLRCPNCSGTLNLKDKLYCNDCGQAFPLIGDIPLVMPKPDELIGLWQKAAPERLQRRRVGRHDSPRQRP